MKRSNKGFTLIELMIVVAIIGILAAVAMPRFADLVRKSSEGATKGSLGAIRSALSIYYADNEGRWPDTLAEMCAVLDDNGNVKYMASLPVRKVGNNEEGDNLNTETDALGDTVHGWYYNNSTGDVMVNSLSGTDTKGNAYSGW